MRRAADRESIVNVAFAVQQNILSDKSSPRELGACTNWSSLTDKS